ncbi:efflux RND transporter periplasmic adaptor subunit [Brucella tritici]|uniref:Efflux RND transporter periplasmic adaptor subunit n=1 Tax=Brucella tritici TaxID=94626 RepID=A0A6L3Y3V7_9HYPH|nr:efflux RND transporter periplasmic adaptor subunit [Brucella tritici]KAB2676387.1 efflux RND transporter periplasmic adaptor subunit [Brucella tritici]
MRFKLLAVLSLFLLSALLVFVGRPYWEGPTATSQASFPPPTVKTVEIKAEDVTLNQEYPGRLAPVRLAEVRARVSGIVLARRFTEGADVKAGDILFEIDPAKFKAAADSAAAQLERAEAALTLASQRAERAQSLLQTNVASKDQFETAIASRKQAEAEVAVAKANLQTAELELSYASVRSPIDGRIGAALVTEGAFVRQEDGTQMATIRDLSSVYVDFTASLSDLAKVQEDIASGVLRRPDDPASVELITNSGSAYDQPGRLLFSSAVVNETTGQVTLRAEFPNGARTLLPGTYVRVRTTAGIAQQVLLVPQRAVQWDTLGQAKVLKVVDGKAVSQPVVASRSVGNRWLVSEGLAPGDLVIVDGGERAMPGSPVTAEALPAGGPEQAAADGGCDDACTAEDKI